MGGEAPDAVLDDVTDRTTARAGAVGDDERRVLPRGRPVELRRRGRSFVREVPGPPGAPTVLLLHGWLASAGLNWFRAFDDLGRDFNVVAPDLRGHARGLRSRRPFTLAACADDTAETLLELGTGPVIAVGYSMGGPVAQLLWRRHRDLVAGLVLCATSHGFMPVARERIVFQTMTVVGAAGTRFGGMAPMLRWIPERIGPFRVPTPPAYRATLPAWAAAEFRRHDWRHVIEAGHAIGTYHARRWIQEVDVPTTVVVTEADRAVPPRLQRACARAIPGARVQEVAAGHLVCATPGFGRVVHRACADVAERAA